MSEISMMNEGDSDAVELLDDDNRSSSKIVKYNGPLLHEILKNKDRLFETIQEGLYIHQYWSLLSEVDKDGCNPLHVIAETVYSDRTTSFRVAKLLTEAYKKEEEKRKEAEHVQGRQSSTEREIPPLLVRNRQGDTPLGLAVLHGKENLASYFLSLGKHEFFEDKTKPNYILFYLLDRKWFDVIDKVLDLLNGPKEEYIHLLRDRGGRSILCNLCRSTVGILKRVLDMFGPLLSHEGLLLHWIISADNYFAFKYVLLDCYEEGSHLDLRKHLIDQLTDVEDAQNVLHMLAMRYNYSFDIVELLVQSYKKEENNKKSANLTSSSTERKTPPWLMKDKRGKTPLRMAIKWKNKKYTTLLFPLDKREFLGDKENENILFEVIDLGLPELAESILDELILMSREDSLYFLIHSQNKTTALHYVPYCTEKYMSKLLKDLKFNDWRRKDVNGATVVHKWVEIGKLWPFEYLANGSNPLELASFHYILWIGLWTDVVDNNGQTPLDWVAENCRDETIMVKIMKILFQIASRDSYVVYQLFQALMKSPISKAISSGHQQLVIFFLSKVPDEEYVITDREIIFEALENKCDKVVEYLLDRGLRMHQSIFKRYDVNNKENILHFASEISVANAETAKQMIIKIIENFPHFLNAINKDGLSPLDKAAEAGTTWLVKLFLKIDSSSIKKAPGAWIRACEKSHVSTILAFINDSPHLRSICRKMKDSPLHHLKHLTYAEYVELLERPRMLEFKNSVNSDRKTPLHMAIQNGDMNLAEILLTMNDVDRSIKDNDGNTAMDLLKRVWDESEEWKKLCESIEVDPTSKLTYIKSKTDAAGMQTIISLVAALLATITFTAGFTLPGGLDGNNGNAVLGPKPSFVVFLIADSYAMCCSMLVLFCIIWSMISPHDESLLLIDRSLVLLKQSLYGTLIAFAVGVYLVIYQKTLWVAILIIVMCILVVVLTGRTTLTYALKLIPAADDEKWWFFWKKNYRSIPVSDPTLTMPLTIALTPSTLPADATSN